VAEKVKEKTIHFLLNYLIQSDLECFQTSSNGSVH